MREEGHFLCAVPLPRRPGCAQCEALDSKWGGRFQTQVAVFINLCDGTSPRGNSHPSGPEARVAFCTWEPCFLHPHPTPPHVRTPPLSSSSFVQLPSENSLVHGAISNWAPSRPAFPRAADEPWHLANCSSLSQRRVRQSRFIRLTLIVRPRLQPACFIFCAAPSTLSIHSQKPEKINTCKHL